MNPGAIEQPLIPAFSPYEGEKENLSLALEHASDFGCSGPVERKAAEDSRTPQPGGFRCRREWRGASWSAVVLRHFPSAASPARPWASPRIVKT
jgi:hypothetical protein